MKDCYLTYLSHLHHILLTEMFVVSQLKPKKYSFKLLLIIAISMHPYAYKLTICSQYFTIIFSTYHDGLYPYVTVFSMEEIQLFVSSCLFYAVILTVLYRRVVSTPASIRHLSSAPN